MRNYLDLTRTQSYSLLFAIPLLLLYEAGAAMLAASQGPALRNGADVLLRALLASAGVQATAAFSGLLLATAAVLIFAERRKRRVPLRAAVFAGMALESALYAMAFGVTIGTATQWLLDGVPVLMATGGGLAGLSLFEGVVLSLGAGVYEELLFRVLLAGGLFGVFRAGGLRPAQAGLVAAVLAALMFSAFHYVGPYGDPWEVPSFVFRALAGLAFSVLFLTRGFGIAAWTHALYDVFLLATHSV